jgi:hypothetical protein
VADRYITEDLIGVDLDITPADSSRESFTARLERIYDDGLSLRIKYRRPILGDLGWFERWEEFYDESTHFHPFASIHTVDCALRAGN